MFTKLSLPFRGHPRARRLGVAFAAAALAATSPVLAQDEDDFREEIASLKARLEAVEKKAASSGSASIGRRGFEAKSADGAYSFRVRPRVQIDALLFPDDDDGADTFTLRRVRADFQGDAGPLSWRITPELAGTVRIIDAWADLKLSDNGYLRAGKAKGPIGLERLQSFGAVLFNERGLPSNLTPTREIGLQYFANALGGALEWSVGAYNGSLDDSDQSNNANLGEDFDLGARVFVRPFLADSASPFAGLGFGFGISGGPESATIADADRDSRIRYRDSGRATIFRYNDGVELSGDRLRLNPGVYYYRGPFGFLSEFVRSSIEASREGNSRKIDADGFTVQASWILTGENASYEMVRPAHPYSVGGDGWGAFEIGLRYHQLEIDEDAFAGAAFERLARSGSVQKAAAFGIAAKWHLTDNVLATLNYELTEYSGAGAARDTQEVVHTRLQYNF